jgi:hypothetical protein
MTPAIDGPDAWTDASHDRIRGELAAWLGEAPGERLPQTLCCERGGLLDPADWSLSLFGVELSERTLAVRVGLAFTEVVGGCNCHDDPSRHSGFQLLTLAIDRGDGRYRWQIAD